MRASKITSIDFFDDLTSPYARKRFFWGFLGIIFLCILILILCGSCLPDGLLARTLESVADNCLASALIVIGFYLIYMYLIGPNEELRQVTVIRPRDIRERMEGLPKQTRYYTFWGRSGSYFRSNPLIELDKQSTAGKLHTEIDVVLPNPTDKRLSEAYKGILASLGETPSGNALLANVLATTLACAIVSANNKFIKINIYYSQSLPAFRLDLSENGAIATQDDPAKSALFFEPGSEFFEMFRTSAKNEMTVSTFVKWNSADFAGKGLDQRSCDEKALRALGITLGDDDVASLAVEVCKLITKRSHRYR